MSTLPNFTGAGALSSRWGRFTVVALLLFAASTVLLATMLLRRTAPSPAPVQPSMQAPAARDASVVTSEAPKQDATGNAANALPARARPYSSVDVETLAAARAQTEEPTPASTREAEPLPPARDAPAATPQADAPTSQPVAPPAGAGERSPAWVPSHPRADDPPERALREGTTRPPVSRPKPPPRSERNVARAPQPPVSPVIEVAPVASSTRRAESSGAERSRERDAAVDDLDARWDRREQWMRERLRQR